MANYICCIFCGFFANFLITISTNFIYFATRYFFFPCSSAFIFHPFVMTLGKVPIFNHSFFTYVFFCCSNNYSIRIAYPSALQSLSHSQIRKVFPAALTLSQKALKVSFLTWTSLNSKFCILGFSAGLQYNRSFIRKWSFVQFLVEELIWFSSLSILDKSSCCRKSYAAVFYLLFRDPPLFIKSISVCAWSFFVVAVHFAIQTSIACFGSSGYCALYRNSYYSINSLRAFKHSHKKRKDRLETQAKLVVLHTYVENQAILEPILLYRTSKCKQTKEQGSEDCLWTHICTFL